MAKPTTKDFIDDLTKRNDVARSIYEKSSDKPAYDINFQYIAFADNVANFPPIDLNDAEAVKERTENYLLMCVQYCMSPSIPSYALALGTSAQGLEEIFADKRHNIEAQKEIAKGVSKIETVVVNKVIGGKINPVTAIFMLKNHFGYKDSSEISLRGSMVTARPDPKALEDKYKNIEDIVDE